MFTSVKATAISIKPRKWDKAHNADKIERFFREAARDGPDIILTTEGVLEGYVVNDVLEGRKTAQAMLEIAEPIDGPCIDRFRRLAKELRTCLCFGFAERIGQDVYNTAIFIDGDGEIRGKYHKTQLAEGADVLVLDCTYAEGGGPEHAGMDDLRLIRKRVAPETAIILTHLNAEPDISGLENVIMAEDFRTYRFD